jgi:hypothetical protein
VHRLLNPFGFAAGQLAVFQGANEAPIPHHFDTGGREPDPQERKMVRDAPSNASPARTALPTAHFERNEAKRVRLLPNWVLAAKSRQPANDCPDHQKEGRPNAELAAVSAAKAIMRCGVDLGPDVTERGNFFANSFHAVIIPPQTLKRSPRFGGN